jgi:uncharacterized membrane protein YoaK (UPF0700 family)
VDAIGYLLLFHVFTSHMSGNSVAVTIELAQGDWGRVVDRSISLAAFFAGSVVGYVGVYAIERTQRARWFSPIAGIEVVLLCVFLAMASRPAPWMLLLPAAAMGIQTSVLRRAAHASVHTTFVTGMISDAARRLAAFLTGGELGDFWLYAGIWGAFIGGGIAGAAVELHSGELALLIPIAGLLSLIGWDLARPLDREDREVAG